MFSDEDELTPDERAALAALPRELPPGDMLEERTVRALRSEGHFGGLRSSARRSAGLGWRIAAALTLFAGGVATGRYLLVPASPRSAAVTPAERTVEGSNERVVAVEMWL